MTKALSRSFCRSRFPQLIVNEPQKLVRGVANKPGGGFDQDFRDVAHVE
jgi:hypothetical protein